MIGLLLRNLLLNSIKATPEKGIISVNVKEREKFFEFTISDNGDKPSEEEVTKLFNLFDNESQDFYEITQLGLSVCKEIVDKHGGKIWAEANKDKGKNFIFTLMK